MNEISIFIYILCRVDTDSTMNNRMYKIIMQFKENLTKLISHKGM